MKLLSIRVIKFVEDTERQISTCLELGTHQSRLDVRRNALAGASWGG